jgi:hypothetical protein
MMLKSGICCHSLSFVYISDDLLCCCLKNLPYLPWIDHFSCHTAQGTKVSVLFKQLETFSLIVCPLTKTV